MKKQGKISKWLGRIFSVSSIALIVSIIGVIYAIKQYHIESSGEMSLIFTNGDNEIDFSDTEAIFYLHEIDYEDSEGLVKHYQPVFKNKTDVALKNISVRLVCATRFLNNRLNTELYSIAESGPTDNGSYTYIFNYKKNFLEAHGRLPEPLKYSAVDYNTFYSVENDDKPYPFKFYRGTISYDEIKAPINFSFFTTLVEDIDDDVLSYFYDKAVGEIMDKKYEKYKIIVGDSILTHIDDMEKFLCHNLEKQKSLSNFGKTYHFPDQIPE